MPGPVAAQTSITLDNGEGAILVEEETDGPDIAGGSTVIASGPTNGPAAALSASSSTSATSVSQDSSSPSCAELLAAESFDRLLPGLFLPNTTGEGLPAEQRDPSAELDQFLSLCAMHNLSASDAGSIGPVSNLPTQSGQAPMTASDPRASLWLGSLWPSKTYNNSSFDESTSPSDSAVSDSSIDVPVAPSSAD